MAAGVDFQIASQAASSGGETALDFSRQAAGECL